jgi:hypothetical protein
VANLRYIDLIKQDGSYCGKCGYGCEPVGVGH